MLLLHFPMRFCAFGVIMVKGVFMLSNENLCANLFENLQAIRGETVKGVLYVGENWLIIFESGYSLEVHATNASFWINDSAKTKELIQAEANRRKTLIVNLEEVKKLL